MIALVNFFYLSCYYHDKEWMNWPAHTHFYFFLTNFVIFSTSKLEKNWKFLHSFVLQVFSIQRGLHLSSSKDWVVCVKPETDSKWLKFKLDLNPTCREIWVVPKCMYWNLGTQRTHFQLLGWRNFEVKIRVDKICLSTQRNMLSRFYLCIFEEVPIATTQLKLCT
jgi:hypothetical protein